VLSVPACRRPLSPSWRSLAEHVVPRSLSSAQDLGGAERFGDPMRPRVYVIAGTFLQFEEWRRSQLRDRDYWFVRTADGLLGLEDPVVRCVGSYWDSPVYDFAVQRGLVRPTSTMVVMDELRALQQQFRGTGRCRVVSEGDRCKCGLCVIDRALALLGRADAARQEGA